MAERVAAIAALFADFAALLAWRADSAARFADVSASCADFRASSRELGRRSARRLRVAVRGFDRGEIAEDDRALLVRFGRQVVENLLKSLAACGRCPAFSCVFPVYDYWSLFGVLRAPWPEIARVIEGEGEATRSVLAA
ncbi:hypothetical protein ACH429_10905 [Streptomyces pathocidini]|uniref:Uncharacterized protein n=1 Tax=Streptomyces pathocidini TaxID=1650571 RepID=A0ABW7UPQ4_9ACTN